jgi:hypothetical protein
LKVQERETLVRDVESEADGRVEVRDEVDEVEKVILGAGGDTKAIVNESAVESRFDAGVLCQDLLLKVTHEETCVAGSHSCPHGHTTHLEKVLAVELKRVEGQDEFRETENSSDRQSSMVLGKKVFDGQQTLRVRDAGVESSNVHSEQVAVLAVRGKGKVLKKLECVVGVLEVGWEPSDDGLKDEVKKAGDLNSRTGAGRNNGASRGVNLVDFFHFYLCTKFY